MKRTVMQVMTGLALAGSLVACGGEDLPAPGAMTPVPGTGGTTVNNAISFSADEQDSIVNALKELDDKPWIDRSNAYGDNPAAAIIGQKFYFETRYSSSGTISCATCHNPTTGFQDGRGANTSSGPDAAIFTGRHAPTVINAAYGSGDAKTGCWQFWDGRADSLWAQALGPPESEVEMGGTRTGIALLIQEHYKAEYEAIFGAIPDLSHNGAPVDERIKGGTPEWNDLPKSVRDNVNEVYVNFGKAIAAYERKIISRNSKFDRFLAEFRAGKTNSDLLSDEEKIGLKVFVGKGRCVSCHRGPNFSDWKFHNIAVSQQLGANLPAKDVGRLSGVDAAKSGEFSCTSDWSDQTDKSQCAIATAKSRPIDEGAFKTPGLRDVSKTGPYMHTGALKTLEEVVEHYNQGGAAVGTYNGVADVDVLKLNLTDAEKKALVKFMLSLDGEPLQQALLTAPKLPVNGI